MTDDFNPQDYSINPDDFNRFVTSLRQEEKSEIDRIITRYISYEPAMVEAALHVAIDKGLISYDLKERLLSQIRMNFSKKAKEAKRINWESYNAFIGYISRYTDDEILNLIEDPADIVIDVYHAVLVTARERRLITTDDFGRYYDEVLKSSTSNEELMNDDLQEFREYQGDNEEEENEDDEQTEEYITETDEFVKNTGKRMSYLALRGGVALTIAGAMMLGVYIKFLFDHEPVEIIVPIVGTGALGLGILLIWIFIRSRKINKDQ
ncbi:MAG: hypothetical protein NT092_05265 [Bacteroidia bacterium]|nr:hypothetical protein [Bacteroidia bacterium]